MDPVDLVLELSIDSDLQTRISIPVLNYDEDAVGEILQDPLTVIALSDAGAHASQLCDACYTTDFLGRWVRERGIVSLEEGVRMVARIADLERRIAEEERRIAEEASGPGAGEVAEEKSLPEPEPEPGALIT